jgi:HEAT repeat protein
LPSANEYNLFVWVIIGSVAVSALIAFALMVLLVVIRSHNAKVRQRQDELVKRWRDIFKAPYTGDPEPNPLPRIEDNDWFTVLQLFVQFHDIRDHDRHRAHEVFPKLDTLARKLRIPDYALGLLRRGDDAEKLLAVNVLGHVRDKRAYDMAVALCDERGPELSRAAAHCALRIDPRFLDRVLELITSREDWVRSRIEQMLREVGPEQVTETMTRSIMAANDVGKPRLLDYVRFCTPAGARQICRDVLATALHHETIAAALRSLAPLASDDDHATAVRYCRYRVPIVALSALRVLRKCVRYEDKDLLTELTANRDYWVRLRAAEAVVQLYGDTGLAEEFMSEHKDRFARDAIKQAIAERRMFALRKPRGERRGTPSGNGASKGPVPA